MQFHCVCYYRSKGLGKIRFSLHAYNYKYAPVRKFFQSHFPKLAQCLSWIYFIFSVKKGFNITEVSLSATLGDKSLESKQMSTSYFLPQWLMKKSVTNSLILFAICRRVFFVLKLINNSSSWNNKNYNRDHGLEILISIYFYNFISSFTP